MENKGLAPHTGKIFEGISKLECIKPFVLVGGTALSLQLHTRQSEDLDFADVNSIGIMKMETMMRRSKFRDYYDIYSILKNGGDIMTMIPAALEHSGYKIKTKNLMALLTNGELFKKDEDFEQLSPIYNVSSYDIQEYLKALLTRV